jgi:quinol monooxygenase YgiN
MRRPTAEKPHKKTPKNAACRIAAGSGLRTICTAVPAMRIKFENTAQPGNHAMFIAIYQFKVKTGHEEAFRRAWLELTQGIYLRRGSLGSRLHLDAEGNYLGYAQWPDRATWEKAGNISLEERHLRARERMRATLLSNETIFEMEVTDDYLQIRPFA